MKILNEKLINGACVVETDVNTFLVQPDGHVLRFTWHGFDRAFDSDYDNGELAAVRKHGMMFIRGENKEFGNETN